MREEFKRDFVEVMLSKGEKSRSFFFSSTFFLEIRKQLIIRIMTNHVTLRLRVVRYLI